MSSVTAPSPRKPKRWRSWRRQLLTQEFVDEIAGFFKEGATVKIAAGRVGVPPGILRGWLREGERQLSDIYESDVGSSEQEPELEGLLYHDCARATAEYLQTKVGTVNDPSDADWRAASWLLERRDEDFNPAAKVEVSGPQGGPIEHEGRTISALVDVIAFAQGIGAGHFLGLDAGDPERALPAAETLLPDPPAPERPAEPSADVPGT